MTFHSVPLSIPRAEFAARVAALAARVKAEGAGAYVGTRLGALHYLGGVFMPWRGAVVVTRDGACEMVYWAMDAERVRAEGCAQTVTDFTGSALVEGVAAILARHGLSKLPVGVDLEHPGAAQVAPGMLTAGEYLALGRALPEAKLVNGVDWIDDLMLIKSPAEIALLRRAAEVAAAGFEAGAAAVADGVSENHVAGVVEAAIRDAGSSWAWAITGGTEVGAGDRSAYARGVTQQATDAVIRRDAFVVIDLHSMVGVYLSDLSLPVFLGTPTPEQAAIAACWEEAAATMLKALRPGRPVKDCAAEGHAVFARHGFGALGLPLFGHGLGTCARTRPFVNPSSTDTVREGMVIALGTHLYVPGVGGLRLEYPTVITAAGGEGLSGLPPKVRYLP
ncbi:M24 family metallopeptidase [Xanthobacter pseudotagetidis]|uniref:M24 family metallopeptidase n=1 Tax=Xanthobacter pseudotagetidis TaxID=3119911 RepID=UPI0037276EF0